MESRIRLAKLDGGDLCASVSWCGALFFFSSRRRHTRCSRDWSSDVCSSDLDPPAAGREFTGMDSGVRVAFHRIGGGPDDEVVLAPEGPALWPDISLSPDGCHLGVGRGSGRGRVEVSVGAGSL